MGANAQTTVPTFTASQVLTADQQNQSARTGVPVFASTVTRDAGFGGTGEKTLAEGQLCYVEGTGLQTYNGSAWVTWGAVGSGMAKTGSATGSAAASISVTGCFSSTYTNYVVVCTFTAASGSETIRMRTTTDDSGANYNWTESYSQIGAVGTGSTTGASQTSFSGPGDSNSTVTVATYTIWQPNTAAPTWINGFTLGDAGGGNYYRWQLDGWLNTTTQYTGITFLATSLTGTVTVYGYAL